MKRDIHAAVVKCLSEGVTLDANLLLLLLVGDVFPARIHTHKRLNNLTLQDYERLKETLAPTNGKIVVTDTVLAETSNFLGQSLSADERSVIRKYLMESIHTQQFVYRAVPIPDMVGATRIDEVRRFGIADAALIMLARMGCLIITLDASLVIHIQATIGDFALNYNHFRCNADGDDNW